MKLTSYCWCVRPDKNPKACEFSKCCYDATCKALFDYWKFAQGKKWREILKRELEKEKGG